jgi:uncharacterized protein (DUF433 family)
MEHQKGLITINPEVRFGKPCLKDTRITVSDVLQWFASGMSENEILEDYPYLTKEKIRSALAYAALKEDFIKIVAA